MCGIAGIFATQLSADDLRAALGRMEQSLIHRGPDGGGTLMFTEPRGGLAVRRLSIVDLEHGDQPMPNEDDHIFALLNGEIYNHRELREDLLARGHRFRGTSDTEAALHLYEEYGEECFARLHGMFALAFYDTRQRRLLLARDGPGMKPLYFAQTAGGFLFASEAKALFASGVIRAEPNPAAIDTYLAAGWVPAPLSAFRGVEKLRPGQYLVVDSGGVRHGEFWKYRYQPSDPRRNETDYSAELESLLAGAVRSHLAADVPVGAFLSGGWDSSLTATFAAQIAGRRLKTFSVVFPDDADADESRFSRRMAQHLGSDHHEIEYRNSLIPALLPKVARHMEEPCARIPAAVEYQLASLAGAHVKTVLSGEGSDELFAGYDRFLTTWPFALRRVLPRAPARVAARWCRPARLCRGLRFFGAADERAADVELYRLFTLEDKRLLLKPEFRAEGPDIEPAMVPPGVLATCHDTLDRRLSFEFTGRLASAVLHSGDRMLMAHSLESRMPFLDRSIVEFALRLPSRFKAHRGRAKRILAGLAQRHLPPEIAARRKKGLGYPHGFWLRPPCNQYARELLLDSAANSPFDADYLARNVPRWLNGRGQRDGLLANLVVLQTWWNEFFSGAA